MQICPYYVLPSGQNPRIITNSDQNTYEVLHLKSTVIINENFSSQCHINHEIVLKVGM
jgi:hypothetical protein